MFEIAVMNPRRSRKGRKKHRSNPAMKRNSKGRFVKRASNPRRRKRRHNARRKVHRVKRARAVSIKVNPRRRRRRSNPRHHYRVRRRRSNPISLAGITSGLVPSLTNGAIGGAGALVNSILLGYLSPMLPSTMTTGYAYDAVRIASAAVLGIVGKKFGGSKGAIAGEGAMAVAMYFLLRDICTAMVPTLPLGDYEEVSIDGTADQLGAYMDPARPLGAYLPDGSRARPGIGAYMRGYEGPDANFSEPSDGFNLGGTDY